LWVSLWVKVLTPRRPTSGKNEREPNRMAVHSVRLFSCSNVLCHDLTHRRRSLFLHLRVRVGVGAQRETGIGVSQHPRHRSDVHAVLQRHRGEGVPLRYNYDKPEKPRISRVLRFGA